jgi:hypothetical protein
MGQKVAPIHYLLLIGTHFVTASGPGYSSFEAIAMTCRQQSLFGLHLIAHRPYNNASDIPKFGLKEIKEIARRLSKEQNYPFSIHFVG